MVIILHSDTTIMLITALTTITIIINIVVATTMDILLFDEHKKLFLADLQFSFHQ